MRHDAIDGTSALSPVDPFAGQHQIRVGVNIGEHEQYAGLDDFNITGTTMNQEHSYNYESGGNYAAGSAFDIGLGGDVQAPPLPQNPYKHSTCDPPTNPYVTAVHPKGEGQSFEVQYGHNCHSAREMMVGKGNRSSRTMSWTGRPRLWVASRR